MENSTEVKIFPKPSKVAKALAKELLAMTQSSQQPKFHLALSGGSTPQLLFEVLAEKYADLLPWQRLHFWWGDERCVPPGSEESNFKAANDTLFSAVPVPEANIHRIHGEDDPEKEAERYSREIVHELNLRGQWPVFDLIILGMGNDGHTASIFPSQPELLQSEKICVVATHPASGQKRITLTGKVINQASRIFFLVTGEEKAGRVSEIMNNDPAAQNLPANFVNPEHGKLIWFLDEAAASLIS